MTLTMTTPKVTLTAERVDANPNMPDFDGQHYKVTLRYKGRRMTLPYSLGWGFKNEPTADQVMETLMMDALPEGTTFEEWARDLGYNPDSRWAERTFKAVVRQTARTKKFLGADFDVWRRRQW